MTEIIYCPCHICAVEFDLDKGGMCDNCMEPTCEEHLLVQEDGAIAHYLCTQCKAESAD